MKNTAGKIICLMLLLALMLPMFDIAAFSLGEDIKNEVTSTGLSVVCIDVNDGSGITDRETYKEATMYIRLNEEYAEYTNDYTEPEGAGLVIKGRGNSTWTQFQTRKRPYTIKLDKKTELFGMRKSKKYTLLANYMDRSNLRNKLAYDLSGALGLAYCQSVFVNLYLNGTYLGVYQLCERPDVDEEIYDWDDVAEDAASAVRKATGMSKADRDLLEEQMKNNVDWITSGSVTFKGVTYKISDYYDYSGYSWYGGYLIEYDYYFDETSKFHTSTGVPLNVRSPENLYTNDTLMNYLQDLFADFEEAIYSDSFYNSKGHHYSEYIDVDTFVDFYIVNALFLNVEFGYKSVYLYIDETGIIRMGPVWDFDWSSGNHFLGSNGEYNKWYNDWRGGCNTWYRQLYGDPWFVAKIEERWFEVQDEINAMISDTDYYYTLLNPASTYEISVYSSLSGENDFRRQYAGWTFKQEVDQLRTFLKNRRDWMSSQFRTANPNIEDNGPGLDTRMIMTLTGTGVSAGTGKEPLINYDLTARPEDEITFTFSLNSAAGVKNTFEIYVNGIYYDEFTAQSASLKIPCSLFEDGVNVITAVRVREGVYYHTCNYITVNANIYGRKVVAATVKTTAATMTNVKNRVTLVELGSVWKYSITTRDGFNAFNSTGWNGSSFNDSGWNSHASPLGDRLGGTAKDIGWTGNDHSLFVRQTFSFDKSKLDANCNYYLNVYYDNTFHVYLNGHEIYMDDAAVKGGNDWTDAYAVIKLSDITGYIKNGTNVLACSINDDVGGREFDLSLFAVNVTDSTYKNPAVSNVPEETVLDNPSLSFFASSRVNANDKSKSDMLILVNVKSSDLLDLAGAILNITFTVNGRSETYKSTFSELTDFSGLTAADGTTYVPRFGFTVLGMVIPQVSNGWSSITVSAVSSGKTVSRTTASYETVMRYYK